MRLFYIFDLKRLEPNRLFQLYITSSLIVILIGLGGITLVLSSLFAAKEHRRSQLSLDQLGHYVDFQYRSMAEEMWTKNYEAIALRVEEVARQLGDAKFEVFLANEKAECVFASSSGLGERTKCQTPDFLLKSLPHLKQSGEIRPILDDNDQMGHYVYIAPLYVGSVLKGYITAKFSDQYDFFTGSFLGIASKFFFPSMFCVLTLWFLWLLVSRTLFLKPYLNKIVDLEKSQALGALTSQVAHDIRSPLAALSVVENDLGEISEEKRLLIRGAINRIRDIANNLLSHNKETKIDQTDAATSVKSSFESVLLSSIIEPLVSEKRLQYRSNMDITIDFEVDSKYYGLFSSLDATEFKRVLSNIINNAVEAISGKGIVQVSLSEVESKVLISVSDNGKGMPEDLLQKLGQKGITAGKQDGHGLGLHHAVATVKAWGGELNVQSTVNSGTTVNIKLAKAPTPDWFVPKIELIEGAHVVVIDDDSSIHGVWDGRFTSLKVQLLHFTEPKRFGEWFIENLDVSPVLFLVDFELLGSKETGLDIIQKYGIQKNSILVTSRFEEPQIRETCRRLGVKLIPKGMAGFVPVGVSLS